MTNIKQFLATTEPYITLNYVNNGYMIEVSGQTGSNEYKTVKLVCTSIEEVLTIVNDIDSLPKDN